MNNIIELKNIKKRFNLKKDSLFEHAKYINSLSNINFSIKEGDCIGIIGNNGSGKTTLLKILSGIIEPTGGKIKIPDKILTLLDVGGGIQEELTGKENIYFYGSLLGIKKEFLEKMVPEILDFSGIRNFLDIKMKYYSTGMKLRLIFAISMSVEHDIYLIDEILAVGDNEFQQKCLGKLRSLRSDKKTIVIASHDFRVISELCDKVIVMHKGKILTFSKPGIAIAKYLSKNIENIVSENTLLLSDIKVQLKRGSKTHMKKNLRPALVSGTKDKLKEATERTIITSNLFLDALYSDLKKNVSKNDLKSNYLNSLVKLKSTLLGLKNVSGEYIIYRKLRELFQTEILISMSQKENKERFREILCLFDKELMERDVDLAKLTRDFGDFLKWINIDLVDKSLILDALEMYKEIIDKRAGDVSFNQWNYHQVCINFIISADYELSCEENKAAEKISQKRIMELTSFRENVNRIRLTAAGWTK